jgi:hypothetical protein
MLAVRLTQKTDDLLERFIRDKLSAVPARPPRVGIRPDEPRPFGRRKAHAALEHLRLGGGVDDLAALAKKVGVSAALLFKWRCCEPRFAEAVDAYQKEFVAVAAAAISDRIGDGDLTGALRRLGDFGRWSPRVRDDVTIAVLDAVDALPGANFAAVTAASGLRPVVGAGLPEGEELGFWATYMAFVGMLEIEARRQLDAAVAPAQREAFAPVFDAHERVSSALMSGVDAIVSYDANARAVFKEYFGPVPSTSERTLAGAAEVGQP